MYLMCTMHGISLTHFAKYISYQAFACLGKLMLDIYYHPWVDSDSNHTSFLNAGILSKDE